LTPSRRLILLVLAVGLPSALAAALVPGSTGWMVLTAGLVFAAALADALLGRRLCKWPSITLPASIRAYKERRNALPLRIGTAGAREVVAGLPWPAALNSDQDTRRLELPAADTAQAEWPFTPLRRGDYAIPAIHLNQSTPLGLWDLRTRQQTNCTVHVYPNLRRIDDLLALRRDNAGAKAIRQIGKGREFEKLRDYLPGDGFDEIHWKATARRGRPVTKVFQVEQTREIYAVLDCARLTGRAESNDPAAEPRLERYMNAALILGMAAQQSGDLFGLMAFSDRVETFVRARKGTGQAALCRQSIYKFQPKPAAANFEEAAVQLRTQLSRRALVLFLTDLDDPVAAAQFAQAAALLRGQHLVMAAMIAPPGAHPLFTRPDVQGINDVYQEAAGHVLWRRLKDLEVGLRHQGINFTTHPARGFSQHLVNLYRQIKQRQIL